MVTNEEILSQIELKKQEIALAQQELQNRNNISQYNASPKESLSKKAFKMFYDFTKPKQKYQPLMNSSGVIDKDKEIDYFKKILQQKDIEIRKQRHMITKMNAPRTYIKKDFMKSRNIVKNKTVPRESVKVRPHFYEYKKEAWLK